MNDDRSKAIIEELIEAQRSNDKPRYNRAVIAAEIYIGKRKEVTIIRCDDINDMDDPPGVIGRNGPIKPRPFHPDFKRQS